MSAENVASSQSAKPPHSSIFVLNRRHLFGGTYLWLLTRAMPHPIVVVPTHTSWEKWPVLLLKPGLPKSYGPVFSSAYL